MIDTARKRMAVTMFIVATIMAAPALGQNPNPFYITPHCEFNPPAGGSANNCLKAATKEVCEARSNCWWRDTTAQNVISQHTFNEFTDTVYTVYSNSGIQVLVYSSASGPNVAVLKTPTAYLVVGTGGSTQGATQARSRLATYIVDGTLAGIVYPNAYPESYWGSTKWAPSPTVYGHAGFNAAIMRRANVQTGTWSRWPYAYGTFLAWGVDDFLGDGWAKEYRVVPNDPNNPETFTPPTVPVSAPTDVFVGGVKVVLIPGNAFDADLIVYLPDQSLAIVGSMGKYFPTAASLIGPSAGISEQINRVSYLRSLAPSYLVPLDGIPIVNSQATVLAALSAQRDALQYVEAQTTQKIAAGMSLDDIVTTVALPASLINSPYNFPLVANVSSVVRSIYHEYMGWWDGDEAKLNTLPPSEHAARIVALAGGESKALAYALACLTEHTRNGAIMAVEVLGNVRRARGSGNPNPTADAMYVQALKMVAWTEPSAPVRNYYLQRVLDVGAGQP